MGYVFDAMNRANPGEPDPRRDEQSPPDKSEAPVPPRKQPEVPTDPVLDGEDDSQVLERIGAPASAEPTSNEPDLDDDPPLENHRFEDFVPDDEVIVEDGRPDVLLTSSNIDDRLLALTEPNSVMAEEYRSIRTSILARWQHKRNLVHTITSATPQEGKTITSVNLGFSFAELRNRRTVVIEGDLRLPQFAKLMNLPETPGLIGLLTSKVSLNDATLEFGDTNLHIIPAGRAADDHALRRLHGSRMQALLQQLRQKYDHVIVDTPPVVELADAGIMGALSDDVFLIARMGRTPQPLIEQAIRTLKSYNAPVAGLIATDQMRGRSHHYYKYGYRYRYRYHNRYHNRKAA